MWHCQMQWSICRNMQLLTCYWTGAIHSIDLCSYLAKVHIKYESKLLKLENWMHTHTHTHILTHSWCILCVAGKKMKKWTLELLRKRARQCLNFPQDVRYVKSNI